MEILKLTTGAAIKFPYALKDSFRAAFPSAKWNSSCKQWEVGPRSIKRLEQWVAATSAAEAELAQLDERELTATELETLAQRVAAIREQAQNALAELDTLEAQKAKLVALHAELAASKGELARAQAAVRAERAAITQQATSLYAAAGISQATVENLKFRMAKYFRPRDRENFNATQLEAIRLRRQLAEAGWSLVALDFMSEANFNRPDRDGMDRMPIKAMIDFRRIESDK